MENLIIEPTDDTPVVLFNSELNTMELSGKSYPDNVFSFYEPVLDWLKTYASNPGSDTHFIFKLDYFNTASAKILYDIFTILDSIQKKGNEVNILWHYKNGDDDMKEAGEGYERIINTRITLVCDEGIV